MSAPAIVFLTDFGTADGYVASMKGVLLSMAPAVPIIDASHDIPAQDIQLARLTLARYWRRFPSGTVHLCVVDPGVGTSRAAIAIESNGQYLVGPDNGVLSPALFMLDARVVAIPVSAAAAPTFHGRDVFAPAAARLARGELLSEIGEPYGSPLRLRTPQPVHHGDGVIAGEVIAIDRFGNAVTNIVSRAGCLVDAAGHQMPLQTTYAEAAIGQLVAVTGSTGLVEVAVRNGSAAAVLGLERGAPVTVRPATTGRK